MFLKVNFLLFPAAEAVDVIAYRAIKLVLCNASGRCNDYEIDDYYNRKTLCKKLINTMMALH